jgi:DNA-binding NarL/FixJ family response regulator
MAASDKSSVPFALIVEDHPLVADSLVACIHYSAATLAVETAKSLHTALRLLEQRPAPLLIVTDLMLTDTQGTDAVKQLREAAPHSPLLVFTALDEPALRSEAKKLGARAYLVKSASTQALRDEIRAAIGEHAAGNEPASQHGGPCHRLLTAKQLDVLEELAAGHSNKEIALRLDISEETVRTHIKEILSRLAVKNRTEAVVRYLTDQHPAGR